MLRTPIRLRLTIAFALSMAVLLASASTFLYVRLADELRAATDSSLRAQADVLVSSIGQGGAAFGDTAANAVQEGQPFAQIVRADGTVLESSEVVAKARLLAPSTLGGLARPTFFDRSVPGIEGATRLYAVPVADEGQPAVVIVGASLSNRQEILARFLLLLVVGGPIALALASAVGWAVAGAALRPVERMRQEAAAISVSDRGRRLPVPATHDELERLGSTLNSMLERLEEAVDRERRFVDDASHELRTPISILKAELDLALSRARSPEEITAALRSASEEADRLLALAQHLLAYSTAERGSIRLHRESIRVDDLAREVVASFASSAARVGVRIDVWSAEISADIDVNRARQAVSNVIDNALRHTPPGGSITLSVVEDPGTVHVVVDDSGAGFDQDLVRAAFEPFARGAVERATAASGAGLGLAIVRAVAEAHSGTATIENRPEGGARVTISFGRGQ
jgi:heavy metal sensor kinase